MTTNHSLPKLYTHVTELFNAHPHVAHDIKHATRSAHLARYIASRESYDETEAEIAGLLHDLGRTLQDEDNGHGPAGVKLASELLATYTDYDKPTTDRILAAVHDHSERHTTGRLTHIVQDADMLDGLGAIGLMRAYMSGSHLPDYDPANIIPAKGLRDITVHQQIAYQMEWLDFMHTHTAKTIAQRRHAFMKRFLEQFRNEANALDLKTP